MAVAAYASLLSLTHVLDNLHYRSPFHLPLLDVNLVQSLQQSVDFLLKFVELHSLETQTPGILDLWRRLAEVAFEAQKMVDSHVVNLLYLRSQGQTSVVDISDFCDDLESIISKLGIIKEGLPQIVETFENPAASVLVAAASSATSSGGKSVVVGFDEHVIRIMDRLTVNKGDLQIHSIVGMGGIGKTTLAKLVYDNIYVVNYFYRRYWVTISQEFSVKEILIGLLDPGGSKELCRYSVEVLQERLYQELFDRRYLVVMDDMWSTKAWDDLQRYFPDNRIGSRILVTTRDSNVASGLGHLDQYPMSFLNGDTSWDLFCEIVFAQRSCPYTELEEIGKAIVRSCRGLPLEISVIGRLLANSDMTQEYWEDVYKNISNFGNLEDDEHCLKILSLSYRSLPIHLKPCFLYLRVFVEDAEISESILIQYWIAEGFIKPSIDKILEEIAKQYIEDLANRSLMFKRGDDGYGDERYGVHDLLRDLCIRESIKECFIESPKVIEIETGNAKRKCLLCGNQAEGGDEINTSENGVHFPPLSHNDGHVGVVCGANCQRMFSHITKMKLVKTITIHITIHNRKTQKDFEFPTEVQFLQIMIRNPATLYHMIHLLWNLEILRLDNPLPILLPYEIWDMPNLRYVKARRASLTNPLAIQTEGNHFIVLKNLHNLESIENFECTKEIVDRIPNLKRLTIWYERMGGSTMQPHHSLCNIEQLQKLEILRIYNAVENITFPNSLKDLFLRDCQMAWEDISVIGSLPILEKLELYGGIEGREWSPEEGGFVRLKELIIDAVSLECWRVESIHFPVLETLVLANLRSLEEIPLDIGEIPTLQFIEVGYCSEGAMKCAEQIREEQQELGNETLRVDVF